jgi:hypothetical protein
MDNNQKPDKKPIYLIPVFALIGVLFAIFEGVMYYNPFKNSKFWSREYFTRVKKTLLEKYFPIDGPHLVKQALVVLISTLPFLLQDLRWYEYIAYPIAGYTVISTSFNILLNYLKNKGKRNER